LNPNVFCDEVTEKTTRFLNQSVNFSTCFLSESEAKGQGTAPDLWNYDFGVGVPSGGLCFGGAGNSEITLTNYSDIPGIWGGELGTGFKTQWELVDDTPEGRTVAIPVITNPNDSLSLSAFSINWGDGTTTSSYDSVECFHEYETIGTKTIEIKGALDAWSFGFLFNDSFTSKLKVTKIIDYGDSVGFEGFTFLESAFEGCTNFNGVPIIGGFLAKNEGVVTFKRIFFGCTSLTSVSSEVFKNHNTNLRAFAFNSSFDGSGIIEIPVDLFRYNVLVGANGFEGTFENCISLTTIPSDLFKYNINTLSFYKTFKGCTALPTIPSNLFQYNTAVTSYAFRETFMNCTTITTVPLDLFRYNTLVAANGFIATFSGCTLLATVPADLFRYNTAVSTTGFNSTFRNCTKLQLNVNIFCNEATERTTRFLNRVTNFQLCFDRTSFTGTQGTAPNLWNYTYGASLTKTDCFNGAGNSITSLTNYAVIPAVWK